jgi:hypothetical protein
MNNRICRNNKETANSTMTRSGEIGLQKIFYNIRKKGKKSLRKLQT